MRKLKTPRAKTPVPLHPTDLPGKVVARRKVHVYHGTEGPSHDPYGYTEVTVWVNDREYCLHDGLVEYLTIDGRKVEFPRDGLMRQEFKSPETLFEFLTGANPYKWQVWYDRLHPYYPDPMGSLRSYE